MSVCLSLPPIIHVAAYCREGFMKMRSSHTYRLSYNNQYICVVLRRNRQRRNRFIF